MNVRSIPQILISGAIIFVGGGFLLNALGVWDFGTIFGEWWPALIILVGLASLLTNPATPLWPVFVIGAGFLLLLRTLGAVDFKVWEVIWPAALILLGLSFFFKQLRPRPKKLDEDKSDLFVAFSGIETANKSNHYTGGKLNAVFGGIELDLSDAKFADRAKLEVFAAFGGIELKVPANCIVHINGLPIFGGWEDKTKKPTGSGKHPVLEITGTCMFGGVSVKN